MSILDKLLNMYWALYAKTVEKTSRKDTFNPYKSDATNLLYNLLFCDNLNLFENNFKGAIISPWKELFGEKDSELLEKISNDLSAESRVRILAYNELRRLGVQLQNKELLGVIVEVGMSDGLDTLAVYLDRRTRYINYSEQIIVWENAKDIPINNKITDLFQISENLVKEMGPWDKKRLPPAAKKEARITFLVSDGLYLCMGTVDNLSKHPSSGPVLKTALELRDLLINKVLNK